MGQNNHIHPAQGCRIYQMEPTEGGFFRMPYRYVESKGLQAPPAALYKTTLDIRLQTEDLSEILMYFQSGDGRKVLQRPLFVSDIVELYDEKESRFYYCDFSGFYQVEFSPVSNEVANG